MDGATVGWAAAAGIAIMIVLQFLREFLVDLVIKFGTGIYNTFKWLFGFGSSEDGDVDASDDEKDDTDSKDDEEKG